jgi:hypothetical protein
MAKVVKENRKVTFGTRRVGKHKKTNGPKEKAVKRKYRGQGR